MSLHPNSLPAAKMGFRDVSGVGPAECLRAHAPSKGASMSPKRNPQLYVISFSAPSCHTATRI